MQPSVHTESDTSRRTRTKTSGASAKWFLLFWAVMIAIGVTATYFYSNHMKTTMLQDLQQQTEAQLQQVKLSYEKQLNELNKKLDAMQSKVESFNELLTFTKDNASNKTDNSNKLYTQLNEVKKQLSVLQKKMELLK
ncbi:hypothetical protein [Paenibacillus apiarius]|uniref:Uncharacterized protein n=1 Tax=Paenibacillus apiarius TaxID=46240 RepID=A0ABT4DTI1_9BACL|nr:hypothetical protein [Paenibacillus apiarius]MCY9515213.1 hypothetical protein [Paenibacillus apiarius]MCY9520619.1 hypothetical protein [Paenibacillus apiarius]MCY9550425.1 hypothetical protein [Paenibacillus apiarius]MCY9561479.1 hypothetical protein [Paenibacillus apiarius]MCY9685587.1 hypothetical protein [Paenibacillus apiarius]